MTATVSTAILRPLDVVRVGVGSLGARAARTVLTALGIAIGIAALVSVVGISSSSRADLLAQLDRFGTNLLEVRAGQSIFGEAATLPEEAPSMIRRIGPVDDVSAVADTEGDGATHRSRFSHGDGWDRGRCRHHIAADDRRRDACRGAVPRCLDRIVARSGAGLDGSPQAGHRVVGRFADGVDRRPMVGSDRDPRSSPAAVVARQRCDGRLRRRREPAGSRRQGVEHLCAHGAEICRVGPRRAGGDDQSFGVERGRGLTSIRRAEGPRRRRQRACARCCWHWVASRCWSEGSASPT